MRSTGDRLRVKAKYITQLQHELEIYKNASLMLQKALLKACWKLSKNTTLCPNHAKAIKCNNKIYKVCAKDWEQYFLKAVKK